MLTSTLRNVGGSIMMTIPKPVLEALGLFANEKVALLLEGGRLIIEPQPKPRHTLEELLAQCDPEASPDEDELAWDQARPVGREDV
jgi:antitoxin ChpS